MDFGLGLVLSFTDNATVGINSTVNSLNSLTSMAESACSSLNNLSSTASLSALSMISSQLGNSFTNAGNSILGLFQNVIGQVQDTGSTFQSLRITLKALLKDTDKAETALGKLMDFSATTPFEIGDLTGIFTTITANGLDAFQTLQGATTGYKENLMSAIGDLMAFRPDVPTQQWGLAIRNAFSGEVRSLKNSLDVNVNDMLGRKWGSTGDVAQDFMDLADALGVAGLMGNNMKTLNQTLSNVADQFTRIKLAIADTGVFDTLQNAVIEIASALGDIQGDTLTEFAKSIGGALNFLLSPLQAIASKSADIIRGITKFVSQHPKLMKVVATLSALSGVLLVTIGVALKVISALSGIVLVFYVMQGSMSSIVTLMKTGLASILSTLLPLIIAITALSLAWKTDFGGIKTMTTSFVGHVVSSFTTARNSVRGSVRDMMNDIRVLNEKDDFFSNFTLSIMKVMEVFQALSEAWSTYTLSEDTFQKAKKLGVLPLIESFLDLKYRFDFFKQGFIDGWKEIGTRVQTFVKGFSDNLDGTMFQGMIDGVATFLDKLASGDTQAWYDFGKSFSEFTEKAVIFFVSFKVIDGIVGKVLKLATAFLGVKTAVKGALDIGKFFTGLAPKISSGIKGLAPIFEKGLQSVFGSNVPGIASNLKIIFAGMKDAILTFLGGLSAPVLATVAVIIASLLAYVITRYDEFKAQVKEMFGTLTEELSAIWNTIKDSFASIWDNAKTAIKPVVDSFNTLKDTVMNALGTIASSNTFKAIVTALAYIGEAIMDFVVPVFKAMVRIFSTSLQSIWNFIVTIFNAIVSFIASTLSTLMNIISGIIDIIVGIFTLDFGKILEGVQLILGSLLGWVMNILGNLYNIFASAFEGIVNFLGSVISSIVNIIGGAFRAILAIIQSIMTLISHKISSAWNAVCDIIYLVLGKIDSGVATKFNNIRNSIESAILKAKDTVKSAIDKIKSFFDFDWKLPKLKLPHISITGGFSLVPPEVPDVDVKWYARGAVFDKPSVIGVGEAGKEAVVPLENNTGWISGIANQLSNSLSNGQSLDNTVLASIVTSCMGAISQLSSVISSSTYTPQVTEVTPTANVTPTTRGTSNSYMTSSTNHTVQEGSTDNSITFAEGSIVINAKDSSDEEAIRMAKKIMEYIKRQKEIDDQTNYN